MSALEALWLVSLLLSGIALAVMVGLIVTRAVLERRQRFRDAERRRLLPLLLGREGGLKRLAEAQRVPDLLTDLSIELIQLVRGQDKEAFVASATDLGVADRLRDRMEAVSPRTRLSAAEALADFGDAPSLERLKDALDDSNADVRLAAAISLANVGAAPPARELVEQLGIGTIENSLMIVSLFREIANRNADEIKALIVDPEQTPLVKASAVEALSGSGDYSLVPIIAALADQAQPDSEELPRYLRALGRFAHPAGAKAVTCRLDCEDWRVRAAAAAAAGRIGILEAAPRVGQLLDDPEWWVRFRAGEALTRLGEPGLRTLRAATLASSERARDAATRILAEKGLR